MWLPGVLCCFLSRTLKYRNIFARTVFLPNKIILSKIFEQMGYVCTSELSPYKMEKDTRSTNSYLNFDIPCYLPFINRLSLLSSSVNARADRPCWTGIFTSVQRRRPSVFRLPPYEFFIRSCRTECRLKEYPITLHVPLSSPLSLSLSYTNPLHLTAPGQFIHEPANKFPPGLHVSVECSSPLPAVRLKYSLCW
jgi:hypothetical protein